MKNNAYSFLNVYAPNNKTLRNSFLKIISEILNSQGIKVIGGDLNEINKAIDRKSTSNT